MKNTIRSAAVGLFGAAFALALAAGTASATTGPTWGLPHKSGDQVLQISKQGNNISQTATATAESNQFGPANFNVAQLPFGPDSGMGSVWNQGSDTGSPWDHGSKGGNVTQGNVSSANANAQNDNESSQVNGAVLVANPSEGMPGRPCENSRGQHGCGDQGGSAGCGYKQPWDGKSNGQQGCGDHGQGYGNKGQGQGDQGKGKPCGDQGQGYGGKGQGEQGPSSTQSSEQGNNIGQQASASSESTQVLPINANVSPSLLSVGSNDGSVKQGNVSSANSNAQNENQSFQANGAAQSSGSPQGDPGNWQPGAGAGSTQSSEQGNNIGQQASASSESTQVLPINANVSPSLLSVGSNDGSVKQGNVSSANSNAQNENQSFQANGAAQSSGSPQGDPGNWQPGAGAGSTQSSEQGNNIGQQASASSESTQVLPINANVSPSLLSVGSNDGSVKQGNVSSANSNAQNSNTSAQTNLVGQAVGGLLGSGG